MQNIINVEMHFSQQRCDLCLGDIPDYVAARTTQVPPEIKNCHSDQIVHHCYILMMSQNLL